MIARDSTEIQTVKEARYDSIVKNATLTKIQLKYEKRTDARNIYFVTHICGLIQNELLYCI